MSSRHLGSFSGLWAQLHLIHLPMVSIFPGYSWASSRAGSVGYHLLTRPSISPRPGEPDSCGSQWLFSDFHYFLTDFSKSTSAVFSFHLQRAHPPLLLFPLIQQPPPAALGRDQPLRTPKSPPKCCQPQPVVVAAPLWSSWMLMISPRPPSPSIRAVPGGKQLCKAAEPTCAAFNNSVVFFFQASFISPLQSCLLLSQKLKPIFFVSVWL